MNYNNFPSSEGLYDPRYEHDSCGVGFVCNIRGDRSNAVIKQGVEVLRRLAHRGAVGADPNTGDGAGILIQMPNEFFQKVVAASKIDLPRPGSYGSGLIFLPRDSHEREFCKDTFCFIPVDKVAIGTSKQSAISKAIPRWFIIWFTVFLFVFLIDATNSRKSRDERDS